MNKDYNFYPFKKDDKDKFKEYIKAVFFVIGFIGVVIWALALFGEEIKEKDPELSQQLQSAFFSIVGFFKHIPEMLGGTTSPDVIQEEPIMFIALLKFIPAIIVLIILIAIISSCIKIVPQEHVAIVERLGKYRATWHAGLHFKAPIIDTVARKITLKEQVCDFPPQSVITSDNVTMSIDSVVFIKIFDPQKYVYGIENALIALENLTATTLRAVVGNMILDETLSKRDEINAKMQAALDEATDPWGIKVFRVEVKNIKPPAQIEEVMTKQMRAERERRETVLQAEAHKESVVTRAKGDKEAKVLAAEAERDAQIAIAEGKAKSVKLVYEAEAEGLEMLKNAQVSDTVLKLKGIDALKIVADGRATKIFMPNDLSGMISNLGLVSESMGIGDYTPIDKSPKPEPEPEFDPCIDENSTNETHEAKATSDSIQEQIRATSESI